MCCRKGFTLFELLITAVIIAFILLLISIGVLGEIDKARGSTVIAEARMVHIAAQTVILETEAAPNQADDSDYIHGLTGTIDDITLPVQTSISERLTALLAPDVVLSDSVSESASQVSFSVENAVIKQMTYNGMTGGRIYTVTIDVNNGGKTEVTRNY